MNIASRPALPDLAPRAKRALLFALSLLAASAALAAPRLPQDPAYHRFADARPFAGIDRFADVASNLPFLLVALAGFAALTRAVSGPGDGPRRAYLPYGCFFLGLALTCAGSIRYHLHPANETLIWDRLPMTVAFMAFMAIVIQERIGLRTGLVALGPLIALGAASVAYWHLTEIAGRGDLRPYALVQFGPLIAAPLIMALYRGPYLRASDLLVMLALYGAAKALELADGRIFELTGWISGHTLKHLAAAAAGLRVVAALRRRIAGERARQSAMSDGPAAPCERAPARQPSWLGFTREEDPR